MTLREIVAEHGDQVLDFTVQVEYPADQPGVNYECGIDGASIDLMTRTVTLNGVDRHT